MRVLDYFFASRPFIQLPVWTVFLVSLHYHHRLSGDNFDYLDLILLFVLSLVFASVFYINFVFDRESDELNNKGFFLQKGVLTVQNLLVANILSFLTALFISYYFFTAYTMLAVMQIFVLGHIYSAPPLRLKDRPLSGMLANLYAHGFLVSTAIMPDMNVHNTGLLGWDNPFYFAMTVGSIYLLTTIPDRAGDKATGKRTVAVIFGKKITLILSIALMLFSVYIAYKSNHAVLVYLSLFSAGVILAAFFLPGESAVLFASKIPLLLLTFIACYWYPYYFIFLVALIILTRIYYKKRFNIVYPRVF